MAALAHGEVREWGPWGQGQGAAWDELLLLHCCPGCKSHGDPLGPGDIACGGRRGKEGRGHAPWVLCLEAFPSLLQAGILGEGSRRTFFSSAGTPFQGLGFH